MLCSSGISRAVKPRLIRMEVPFSLCLLKKKVAKMHFHKRAPFGLDRVAGHASDPKFAHRGGGGGGGLRLFEYAKTLWPLFPRTFWWKDLNKV